MIQPRTIRGERGATSLFIVLFSTLLFTVITVGFLSLMISDQRRATDSEWSEGAYDSALAGVEDGKRVLSLCRTSGNPNSEACRAIDEQECDTIASAGLVSAVDGEVLIQSQGGSGDTVNQAYTCVIIRRDTPEYKGYLKHDDSVLIPLETNGVEYDQVTISWFTQKDASSASATLDGLTSPGGSSVPLPDLYTWSASANGTRPPIMRAQLMQYDGSKSINLGQFNQNKYAHTSFLYPATAGVLASNSFSIASADQRNPSDLGVSSAKDSPKSIKCEETIPKVGYACSVTIDLPPVKATATEDQSDRVGLLRLTALYQKAAFRVQMRNSATDGIVDFVGTQPSIDSTGRAGDVFRRVDARINMDGAAAAPYPRATIDVTESLCKNLRLGADADSSTDWQSCNPKP